MKLKAVIASLAIVALSGCAYTMEPPRKAYPDQTPIADHMGIGKGCDAGSTMCIRGTTNTRNANGTSNANGVK